MTRRGFTLIEMMLAATLGALVIATAAGVMGAMARAQRRADEAATRTIEQARLREVIQASLRQIVVHNKPKAPVRATTATAQPVAGGTGATGAAVPVRPEDVPAASAAPVAGAAAGTPSGGAPGGPANALPADKDLAARALEQARAQVAGKVPTNRSATGGRGRRQEDDDTVPPRFLLEMDGRAGGGQRLEVVVAASPWAVKVRGGGTVMPMPEAGGGVRGAFELRPDGEARAGGDAGAVYWCVYPMGEGPGGAGGGGTREAIGEARLCGGVRSLAWRAFRTNPETDQLEPLSEHAARSAARMPAYVEVGAGFEDGSSATWLFEIGYVIGREQDALPVIPEGLAAQLAAAREEDANTPRGASATPVPGAQQPVADGGGAMPVGTGGPGTSPQNPPPVPAVNDVRKPANMNVIRRNRGGAGGGGGNPR